MLTLDAHVASSSVKISPSLVAFNVPRRELSSGACGGWFCMKGHFSFSFFFSFLFSLSSPLLSSPQNSCSSIKNSKLSFHFVFILDWVLLLLIFFYSFFLIEYFFQVNPLTLGIKFHDFIQYGNFVLMTRVMSLKN